MEGTFNLNHTVLYAKGWYKRSESIWEDMQKLLEADGYTMWETTPDKVRITNLLVMQAERLKIRAFSLSHFYEGIQDSQIWKRGYYTKTNPGGTLSKEVKPDYDYHEAVLRYCLSVFGDLNRDHWKVERPDFTILPKNSDVEEEKVIAIFGKAMDEDLSVDEVINKSDLSLWKS